MYGMGDAIRGYQEDLHELDDMVTELKQELKEKDIYITSMEYALSHILDWYWNIEEPGLVPDSAELRTNLRSINKILMNYRGNVNRIKERMRIKGDR
jgi:hypothetical protein